MMTELSLWHDTFSSQSANGTVEEVQLGGVMAHVAVRVGENLVENVITRRSAEAMRSRKAIPLKS
jgi:hypothetical protein